MDLIRSARGLAAGRLRACVVLLALGVLSPLGLASPAASSAMQPAVLEVFVREGCPHCAAAKEFLDALSAQRPALRIRYRWVDRDDQARDALIELSRATGSWPPGVPTFVFDGRMLVGFDGSGSGGEALRALLDRDRPATDSIESKLFGTLSVSQLGLPLFTLAVGLLDGFNPCAMWVLLFLLSLLVRLHDRVRMALIAGCFVLVSGLVYYAFMAAWLNVFLAVGMSTALRIGLAMLALGIGAINVKDYFTALRGFSLSIPQSAKPGLYARMRRIIQADSLFLALSAAAALAVAVNFIELLCTAGFPAMYTAILAQQGLEPGAYYGYLALYIIGYITDDALMVGTAVIALGNRKLTERAGRWLKLFSGVVMLALGAVMLLRPDWLM